MEKAQQLRKQAAEEEQRHTELEKEALVLKHKRLEAEAEAEQLYARLKAGEEESKGE